MANGLVYIDRYRCRTSVVFGWRPPHTPHNGRSPLPDPELHPLQHTALAALKLPRVSILRMGAPPGIYESRYHATAAACSAAKTMTSK